MRPRTIIHLLAVACVAALMIAPAAGAMTDLRSPDARDVEPTPTVVASDLRSPDARDAQPTPTVVLAGDLRSPDTRDAAIGRTTSDAPAPIVVQSTSSGSFDWADAFIGAGTVLVIVALGGGLIVLATHRRRHPATS